LKETDDAFRRGREVREARQTAETGGVGQHGGGRRGGGEGVTAEELREGRGAEAEAGFDEEITPGVELFVVVAGHGGSVLGDRFVEAENHARNAGGGGEFGGR